MPSVPLKFDTSELELATRQLATETGKDLAAAFNKKMGWLLRRWIWNTQKTDFPKMARTLGLRLRMSKAGEKKTKTGKTIKFKARWKASGKTFKTEDQAVPLIVAIIQKRKGGSPYKGKTRREGRRAMIAAVKKKFGARARSISYLKSAIASAQKPFLPFSSGNSPGAPPVDRDRNLKPVGKPKGFGTVAVAGTRMLAVAVDKSTTKRQGAKALLKYAKPALEKAYADELKDTREYLNKVLYDTARRLGIKANR